MNTTGNENLGTCPESMLIADASMPTDRVLVTLASTASGVMELKKGAVLAMTAASEKCKIIEAESSADVYAAYILAEDVKTSTTEDVCVEAYQTGKFVTDKLSVKEGYTLTQADIKYLRDGGIFLENAMV